jgi:hypothetical protein
MLFQIACNTIQKRFIPEVVNKHSNDGASFEITDVVKDLINLKSIPDWDFDWM